MHIGGGWMPAAGEQSMAASELPSKTDADASSGDPVIQRIIDLLPKGCEEAGAGCNK